MTSHDLPTDPDRYTLHHRAIQVSTKRAASLTGARPASLTTRFMPAGWSTGVKSAGHHRVTTLTTRAQAKVCRAAKALGFTAASTAGRDEGRCSLDFCLD